MIEPYDVFKYYMAMKLHFGPREYDCIKYNFKTSVTQKSFYNRKDRYHFAKLGRKFDDPDSMIDFMVSQFVNQKEWIGDMLGKEADRLYNEYRKRHESLGYLFEQDLQRLGDTVNAFDELFAPQDSSPYPRIVAEHMAESVLLESVVILNKLTGFMRAADKSVSDPIIWPGLSRLIWQYGPFVQVDKDTARKKVLHTFTR
jgi:hypothetical protein